jgi:choline kinase
MLDRILEALADVGISRITITVGFEADQIVRHCAEHHRGKEIRFVLNSEYRTTNNAYSLLLGLRTISIGNLLILDGDIVFESTILDILLSREHADGLAVRTMGKFEEEDVKVVVDNHGRILKIGKEIPVAEAFGESIGIERFSGKGSQRLLSVLEKRVMHEQHVQEFYESSFQEMIDSGFIVHAIDLHHCRCLEVDTIEDYKQACLQFGA